MAIGSVIKNSALEVQRLIKREINYYRVKPTHVLLFMTYRCPSRCRTCEIWKWEEMGIACKDKEISLEDWNRFVDMIAELKITNVEIFGGEALLRRDVVPPLVKYIADKNIEADVVTNGLTMDEALAADLVEAGLHDIYFSVDGVGEIHDFVRGVKGNFQKVEEGIRYIQKARGERKHPHIICNCTISSLNVDHFEKVVPFAAEVGAEGVHLEYAGECKQENADQTTLDGVTAHPYFRRDEGSSFLLDRDQAMMLKRKISEVKKLGRQLGIHISSKNIDVLSIDNIVSGTFLNKKCYMIRYFVAVDPYGNIMGCPFFNDYYMGNIREEPLREIWNNEKHKRFMKAQRNGEFEMCNNCIMGVQRNVTFFKALHKYYLKVAKKGVDTPIHA